MCFKYNYTCKINKTLKSFHKVCSNLPSINPEKAFSKPVFWCILYVCNCTISLLLLTCIHDLSLETNQQNGKERHVCVQLIFSSFQYGPHSTHIVHDNHCYQPHIWGSVICSLFTTNYQMLPTTIKTMKKQKCKLATLHKEP